MDWTWGWTAVQAIATGLLVLGIIVAIWQIRVARENTRKSTSAQLAVELLREFRSEEVKDTLRFIYTLSTKEMQYLRTKDKYQIERVFDKFHLLGDLVERGIIEKRFAIQLGPPTLRCWYQLIEYIKEERNRRGYFYEPFEGFVECCLSSFRDMGIKVLFQRKGETDNINLVAELQKEEIRPRSFKEIEKDAKMTR